MAGTIRYSLNGVSFEWDAGKATRNRLRHGVAFELACEVFFDPFARWLDPHCLGAPRNLARASDL
jgi:uncharacterized DUF497 family protein